MYEEQDIVKSVAFVIANLREQSRISVKLLSQKSGLTQQTIHNIETGDTNRVDLVKIHAIAHALGLSTVHLLSQIDAINKKPHKNEEILEKLTKMPFVFTKNNNSLGVYEIPELTDVAKKLISENEIGISIGGFTLESWIFPMDPADKTEEKIIALSPSRWNEIYLGWEKSRVWFGIVPDDERGWIRLQSPPISLFEWHHIVAISNGNTASLFIDQTEVGRVDINQDFSSYKILGHVFLGCLGYEHNKLKKNDRFFCGNINQPKIWTSPLMPFELKSQQLNKSNVY